MSEETFYDDFETEPIGGDNPYHRCTGCGRSVPEINYTLKGHSPNCPYRIKIEAELHSLD